MTNRLLPLMLMLMVSTAAAVPAQKMVAVAGESAKATVVIQQIDSTKRLITFRAEDGTEDTIWAGPEVKRFNELKVGDKIKMTYYESKIFQVRPAGTSKPVETDKTSVSRGTGATPGVTLARQSVETVTVKAIDRAVPSITVLTSDGHTLTRRVDKASYLDGVSTGDKIDITLMASVLASVEHAK